jgi:hypothetical protein
VICGILRDEFPAQKNRELIRDNRELAKNRSARRDEALVPRCRLKARPEGSRVGGFIFNRRDRQSNSSPRLPIQARRCEILVDFLAAQEEPV